MQMKYITIEGIEKTFSTIALGTTYFGTDIEKSLAFRMLNAFAEAGGTTIDTARVYGQEAAGERSLSEEVIGQWLDAHGIRKKMTVVTKGAHPHLEEMRSRISREDMLKDIEMTLKALSLDALDIWMLHRDDLTLETEQIGQMLEWVKERVPVHTFGLSNWSHHRYEKALASWSTPPSASEIQYSLAPTTPERYNDETLVCMDQEEFSYYRKYQTPVFAFSSQAKGFFSKGIEGGIEKLTPKIRSRFLSETNLKTLEKMRVLCTSTGYSPAALSLAALLHSPFPVVTIIGCSSLSQLTDSLKGSDVPLTDEMQRELLGGVYETA